jgi:hypothetical protein
MDQGEHDPTAELMSESKERRGSTGRKESARQLHMCSEVAKPLQI